jgi:hypothetical protein
MFSSDLHEDSKHALLSPRAASHFLIDTPLRVSDTKKYPVLVGSFPCNHAARTCWLLLSQS